MSDENHVILEFKYLKNKKWQKRAIKSARIRRVIEYNDYFHFDWITDNNLQFFLHKLAIFNIYQAFAPFVKLRRGRFLYFFSLCDVRNKAIFLLLKHSSLRWVKLKKHKKHEILAFKPLLQEIRLKNLSSRKIFSSSHI